MTAAVDTAKQKPAPVPEGSVMVTLKVARFNPENGEGAYWDSFQVPVLPTDRFLNVLIYSSPTWTAPSPSGAPVPTACVAPTPCGSTM